MSETVFCFVLIYIVKKVRNYSMHSKNACHSRTGQRPSEEQYLCFMKIFLVLYKKM